MLVQSWTHPSKEPSLRFVRPLSILSDITDCSSDTDDSESLTFSRPSSIYYKLSDDRCTQAEALRCISNGERPTYSPGVVAVLLSRATSFTNKFIRRPNPNLRPLILRPSSTGSHSCLALSRLPLQSCILALVLAIIRYFLSVVSRYSHRYFHSALSQSKIQAPPKSLKPLILGSRPGRQQS
jgi:hypothetical protein